MGLSVRKLARSVVNLVYAIFKQGAVTVPIILKDICVINAHTENMDNSAM